MNVDVIDQFASFRAVRRNWNNVYAADPDAHIFLSWDWMCRWLHEVKTDWMVLAAAPDASAKDYVAFFPIRLRTQAAKNGGFYTEIIMAGNSFADYTGAIFRPEYVDAAIDAFARHIGQMQWAIIRFDSMRMGERCHARLIRHFPKTKFKIFLNRPMLDASGIDNSICPFAVLADSWEGYLARLSANTRQKLRRLLRRLDSNPDLHVVQTTSQTVDISIEILIQFWNRQWADRKGDHVDTIGNSLRTMLKHYSDLGILYMPILWNGEEPAGVLASIVDHSKRVMHFCVAGRDERHNDLQPGLILHAHSIRHAIEMGLTQYDFLRGNERYKYSFGAFERRLCNTVIRLQPRASRKKLLDARSIPRALFHLERQMAAGELAQAEIGYRQVLAIDPHCEPAILGYSKLKLAQGQPEGQRLIDVTLRSKNSQSQGVDLMNSSAHREISFRSSSRSSGPC